QFFFFFFGTLTHQKAQTRTHWGPPAALGFSQTTCRQACPSRCLTFSDRPTDTLEPEPLGKEAVRGNLDQFSEGITLCEGNAELLRQRLAQARLASAGRTVHQDDAGGLQKAVAVAEPPTHRFELTKLLFTLRSAKSMAVVA